MKHNKAFAKTKRLQAGMALVETMIALALLLIVAAGVLGLAAVATSTTENQGHLQARTAEYAQDKMEQLLALTFCDSQTDTTVYPAALNGGQGLAGCTAGSPPSASFGGGLDVNNPVAGYVDYVDSSGNPSNAAANWQYVRVWQISLPPNSPNNQIKQISVKCQVRTGVGGRQVVIPNTTVVALKSYPF